MFSKPVNVFNYDKFVSIAIAVSELGYDIKMLKYCADIFTKFNIKIPSYLVSSYKIQPKFYFRTLMYYSNKIYMPNLTIVKHTNKRFENFINTIFSDSYLSMRQNCIYRFNENTQQQFSFYGFDENLFKKEHFSVINKSKCNLSIIGKSINYGFKQIKYHRPNKKNINIFSEYVLKNCKIIDNLLDDPDFIFTLDINLDKEIFLVYFSYIISLIHNNYNSFIITYLVSFLNMDKYKIIYTNNRITFFPKYYDKIENHNRSIL